MERKLNAAALKTIDEIVAKHQGRPGPVKLMLHDVQRSKRSLPAAESLRQKSTVSLPSTPSSRPSPRENT